MDSMNNPTFPADAKTLNALVDTMGALTGAFMRRLPADEQDAFLKDLGRMASAAEKRGDVTVETLLLTMCQAARALR